MKNIIRCYVCAWCLRRKNVMRSCQNAFIRLCVHAFMRSFGCQFSLNVRFEIFIIVFWQIDYFSCSATSYWAEKPAKTKNKREDQKFSRNSSVLIQTETADSSLRKSFREADPCVWWKLAAGRRTVGRPSLSRRQDACARGQHGRKRADSCSTTRVT